MDNATLAAALRAAANVLDGGAPLTGSVTQPVAQPVAPTMTHPVPQNITADMITALIQPHIGNEAVKAALGAAMRAMGINALPETQPHQFVPLYTAFQQVLAQHALAPAAPPPASTSII